MFHELFTRVPSSVSRRAAPGRTTLVTLHGPSHMGEILWRPSRERIDPPEDEVADLQRAPSDVAAVVAV